MSGYERGISKMMQGRDSSFANDCIPFLFYTASRFLDSWLEFFIKKFTPDGSLHMLASLIQTMHPELGKRARLLFKHVARGHLDSCRRGSTEHSLSHSYLTKSFNVGEVNSSSAACLL